MLEAIVIAYLTVGTQYGITQELGPDTRAKASPCVGQLVDVVGASGNVLYSTCKN